MLCYGDPPLRSHNFPRFCRHVSPQRGVHSVVNMRRVVNMRGVVKTLRCSKSLSRSFLVLRGPLRLAAGSGSHAGISSPRKSSGKKKAHKQKSFFRKAPDTFKFLRHVMRAVWSVRPKCSHRCVSLKKTPLKPVQILKHTTKNPLLARKFKNQPRKSK